MPSQMDAIISNFYQSAFFTRPQPLKSNAQTLIAQSIKPAAEYLRLFKSAFSIF
jgi:hypothetical protein